MERKAFSLLHAMEDSWWYRGRARVIARVLSCMKTTPRRALDLGAGYGGMIDTLKSSVYEVDGVEPDEESRKRAEQRGYRVVYLGLDMTAPPYDLIALFDVLEHVEDDYALLLKLHSMLTEDGHLALTVPAFQWLWSEHDVEHHHFRRYTTSSACAVLQRAGFDIRYISYWNMLLFIPAALVRLMGRSGAASLTLPPLLDQLFYAIVYMESFLQPWLRLPFGTGIVVLARKI
jgi:SAM-dependent methyltransferase